MKKIISNANIIVALALSCVFVAARADVSNGNNGVYTMITEAHPDLTDMQKKQVRDEVMKQDIIQFLNLGELDNKSSSTYEIVSGFIDEAVRKIVPVQEVRAQSEQMIFNSIKAEKGEDALPSVKAVLRHLNAQPLEYIKNVDSLGRYDPAVVRINVPNQTGQTCGIWALANLLAVKKVINAPYLSQRADFTTVSENLFKKHFTRCPKELVDVNMVIDDARKLGFSDVVLVGVDETQGDKIYTYSLVGEGDLASLLQELIDGDIKVINVIIHSKTKKAGKHSEHWTAASIISNNNPLIDGIKDVVVIYMNSVGNDPFVPTNSSIQKALRYISRQFTDAYEAGGYEDIE